MFSILNAVDMSSCTVPLLNAFMQPMRLFSRAVVPVIQCEEPGSCCSKCVIPVTAIGDATTVYEVNISARCPISLFACYTCSLELQEWLNHSPLYLNRQQLERLPRRGESNKAQSSNQQAAAALDYAGAVTNSATGGSSNANSQFLLAR